MIKKILLLIFICCSASIFSQSDIRARHYSVKDGLSQNTVSCMLQDRKGYMWFGTWNGLNRFDGYTFKIFKAEGDETNAMSNNRVDQLLEDINGHIWMRTYDGMIFRINDETSMMEGITPQLNSLNKGNFSVSKMKKLDNGQIWLLSKQSGCVKIETDTISGNYGLTLLKKENNELASNTVNNLFSDSKGNVWILSEGGVTIHNKEGKFSSFFTGKNHKKFSSIIEHQGIIYLGTQDGSFWTYDLRRSRFKKLVLENKSPITALIAIRDNLLAVGTHGNGIILWNTSGNQIERIIKKGSNPAVVSDEIVSFYVDKRQNLWIETVVDGVGYYSSRKNLYKHFSPTVDNIGKKLLLPNFFIFEDNKERLWVHPVGGGFSLYNAKEENLDPFFNETNNEDRLFSNIMHSAYSDRQGNLWLCTYSKGIEKISFTRKQFTLIQPNPKKLSGLAENAVRSIFEDRNGYLWVSTKDDILHLYKGDKLLGSLGTDGTIKPGNKLPATVYTMRQRNDGTLLIGTKGAGIYLAKEVQSSPIPRFSMSNFQHDPKDSTSLSHNSVYSIFEDHNGRFWVGTYGGGVNYMEEHGEKIVFIHSGNRLRNYPQTQYHRVRHISSDNQDRIFIGTTEGLLTTPEKLTRPEDISFSVFSAQSVQGRGLTYGDIHYHLASNKGKSYVATFGGGIDQISNTDNKLTIQNYTSANGLPSEVILAMIEDSKGNVWISTESGLSRFDPQTEQFLNFDEDDGLLSKNFSEAACASTNNGTLLFGCDKGFYRFDPNQINKENFIPELLFSGIKVYGEDENTQKNQGALSNDKEGKKQLVLKPNQKIFTIDFAALDYRNNENINYAYYLEGFENNWHTPGKTHSVTYSNLPHGTYYLRVKSTNADGVWVPNEQSLKIIIQPSFWETTWAYVLYFIFGGGIIGIGLYIFLTIYTLRKEVEVEQKVSQLKLKFFTDISHEFRTPLTLISVPVEHILEKENISAPVRSQLEMVKQNSNRLLRLINQILDFRKIQNKKLEVHAKEINIGLFVQKTFEMFSTLAEERNIDYSLIDQSEGKNIFSDEDLLEKILYNLISNAMKFTPCGKAITIKVENTENGIMIEIADQGVGISEKAMTHLFERFNSSLTNNEMQMAGTGIGLSLVKEYVQLLHGEIQVSSKVDIGTTFTLFFPLGLDHFNDQSIEEIPLATDSKITEGDNTFSSETSNSKPENETKVMLVVEDNTQLRHFISMIFKDKFIVIEAEDGQKGWDKACQEQPDIILSDVMMPVMDGFELVSKLRSNIETSHIPVILLTAKSSIESRLEGLKYGADDYIPKPFSTSYLTARVENLLTLRGNLRRYYQERVLSGQVSNINDLLEPEQPEIIPQDQQFIEQIVRFMEEQMDNSELTVDDLVSHMALGRTVFFKKIKQLIGFAPIEFIREMRIKRAAQLIRSGQYNISQITYMVGMNDPRYFSKCFKRRYGKTPSEYKEEVSKNPSVEE